MFTKSRVPGFDVDTNSFCSTLLGGRPVQREITIEEANRCIAYSRRYERPLSLLTLLLSHHDSVEASEASLHVPVFDARIIVRGRVRETDHILEGDFPNKSVILCPETIISETIFLARRMKNLCRALGIALEYAIAAFPDDGYTIEDLISASESRLESTDSTSANFNEVQYKRKSAAE